MISEMDNTALIITAGFKTSAMVPLSKAGSTNNHVR